MARLKMPNGYGGITKLSGNRRKPWRVRVTCGWSEDGKQQYKNIGYYATWPEANKALTDYHENPYDIDASKVTFAEIYEKWSEDHFKKISDSNIKGYSAAYLVCGELEKMVFADIKIDNLQHVIDTCGKNYPTLRKIKVLFNGLYKYAMQRDLCAKDYSQFVDIAQYKDKNPNKYDRNPLTKHDIDKLWKNKDNSVYIGVMLILVYTGLRISELLELKKENVNLNEKFFYVAASKTDAGIRYVPIADKIMPFFQYWYNKPGSDYLITNNQGRKMLYSNYKESYWKPFIEQLSMNKDYTPHCCRHTCVSLLANAGVDERIIRKIVGHSGNTVTETVYTHLEMEELLTAINLI